ncbi:type II secretion system minor pseudopilin GspK [Hydrogenovibrio thermophilus]|uniref:Type II secretion system protein K n=1 Tax=Hydrogenovibrio thermophilus TaxID=265883 RepID=A0A451G551_9GAMM|nr:type II secretion system minor pseudopilin GspK [Hydrogenovibrio thermophilus]QAB14625.1 hypothetical protein EPV75_02560 [Hydrogenovibrio thermophilus]
MMARGVEHARPQKGFALLTVMIVVALIAIVAAELIYRQGLAVQRSMNMLHQTQAAAVTWGLESWVKKGLLLDARANQTDHLQEEWAQPLMPVPFEGGEVSGQLLDQQGLLNLNNLQETDETLRRKWQSVFERYFQLKELDPSLAAVVIDWVDADNNLTQNGAESDFYLLKQPPYRTANQKMVLVEELGLLKGVTAEVIERVKPELAALPSSTPININTAPELVLQALADWMTPEMATAWAVQRKTLPADDTAVFREFCVAQGVSQERVNEDLPDDLITVQTDYFLLKGLAAYGASQWHTAALFYRKGTSYVNLVQRWVDVADD